MSRGVRGFASTQWSIVVAAGATPTEQSRQALGVLCETYWYPLYAYVRRRGHAQEEAEDLTQAFFARLLEKNYVRDADPQRGHFRAFLLTAFKHFLANEHDRAAAQKRGGTRVIASLDSSIAEGRYQLEAHDDLNPERIYERRWALTLLEYALAKLRREAEHAGNAHRFDRLKGFLTGDGSGGYEDAARSLGMSVSAVKVAVHRLRRRYREVLCLEIAATIADPCGMDDELSLLLSALGP